MINRSQWDGHQPRANVVSGVSVDVTDPSKSTRKVSQGEHSSSQQHFRASSPGSAVLRAVSADSEVFVDSRDCGGIDYQPRQP
jgi:hypothetical protein